MRRKLTMGCAAISAMLVAGTALWGQASPAGPPPPAGAGERFLYRQIGPGPLSPDDAVGFVTFEAGIAGKNPVTGAPFTATFSQQANQVLGDGNHIQRTTSGTVSRDSNGRTRRDLTLPPIVDWATSGKVPPHVVLINDPVAGVDYALEPDSKIARKMTISGMDFGKGLRGGPGGPGGPRAQERQNESTTASLGTQTINGVSAEGTRTTRTIPAGAIGNEKPIVITVERWYSPDLQMNVMIKRSDPRTGENVFQLTNINRAEPDASLFQVPADYTVKEGGKMFMRKGPPLPPPNSSTPQ